MGVESQSRRDARDNTVVDKRKKSQTEPPIEASVDEAARNLGTEPQSEIVPKLAVDRASTDSATEPEDAGTKPQFDLVSRTAVDKAPTDSATKDEEEITDLPAQADSTLGQ